MNTAILVRVSTHKQDTERQIQELTKVAEIKGWTVVEVIREEGISGSSHHRPGLDRALELARSGAIVKVLVHEVSRIGRRNSVVHGFIEALTEAKVSLYWHSQGIETLLENGKTNPATAIMLAVLAEMARAERETLIERINSGLDAARRRGIVLGRKPGVTEDPLVFLRKHADVMRRLREGQSIRHAAKLCDKSTATVQKVKRLMNTEV